MGSEMCIRDSLNILKFLYKYKDCYPVRHKDIAEELGIDRSKRLVHELLKLREYGFVGYESRRYFLTNKGREICEDVLGLN